MFNPNESSKGRGGFWPLLLVIGVVSALSFGAAYGVTSSAITPVVKAATTCCGSCVPGVPCCGYCDVSRK